MPKVSIVIPTYNRANFLAECIESVLAQTYKDYEIIVVDDGSTDNTADLVSPYNVKYLYQENQGVSAARNRGVDKAKGEYVAFLDSDDVLIQNSLEKRVEILDSHPEVGYCYGQAYRMNEAGIVYNLRKSSFLNDSVIIDGKKQISELLYTNRITLSSIMVRKQCLNEIGGFFEEMRSIAEEHHLFIRLAKKNSVAYIAEPLVKLRIHQGGLHKNVDPKCGEKAYLLLLREVFEDPEFAAYFQKLRSKAYFHCYYNIAGYAFGKDMKMTRHYLRKAIKIYPRGLLQKDTFCIIKMFFIAALPSSFCLMITAIKKHLISFFKNDSWSTENAES